MQEDEEFRLQGVPVSEGVAIGIPYVCISSEENIPEFPISIGEVDDEIARYRKALFSSKEDLERLQTNLESEGSKDAASIINSHIQMLEDPMITTDMENKIRQMLLNTESVFHTFITDYEQKFSQTSDLFFQERLVDIMDLSKRILGHLSPHKTISFTEIPNNAVIFAKELVPSQPASVYASQISAFVTCLGGGNSHAAVIARAKGIPYVANIDIQQLQHLQGKCVIVDGQTGEVIINPAPETLEKYKQIKTRLKTKYQLLQKEVHQDAETIDGYCVDVFANISNLGEMDTLDQYSPAGIGLFRSEYLFFQNRTLFSAAEDQYKAYVELIYKAKKLPIVIRVFDVGGDKNPDLFRMEEKEPNPVLGCRGIRFLLKHKDIFKTQLKAILRAAVHGDIRLLLPMISDINELLQTKEILSEVKEELKRKQILFNANVPLGCMIEVPSAVLICDTLAKECDFLSIGTNDLVQYTLGIDRSHPSMSDLCYPAHPSIIRMIKMVVTEGKRHGKPVTVCGEIASNPLFIPLLLGLGLREFSCAPRNIPLLKRAVRQNVLLDAIQIAEKVLSLNTSHQIFQLLIEAYNKTGNVP